MKKSALLLLLLPLLAYSQISFSDVYNKVKFNKFLDEVKEPGGPRLRYVDIEGDVFFPQKFTKASIQNATAEIKTRYNRYTDNVELLQDDEIFVLPRNKDFSRIVFTQPAAVLLFLNEETLPSGYFFEMVPGKFSLLKKEAVSFHAVVPATTQYVRDIPARFEPVKPVYYIKTENKIITVPRTAKDLIALLPDKKPELENFIKSKKMKNLSEEDLKMLVRYLNTGM